MRTTFEEDEDLDEAGHYQDPHDREITLSSMTLLAIFFGLVLLCGLFFGLGYTMGRRGPSETQASATVTPSALSQPAAISYDSKPKPSASSQGDVPQPVATEETSTPQPSDTLTTETEKPNVTAVPAKPQVKEAVLQTTPAAKPALSPAAATTAPVGIMVQIAAISNPADASVLENALRKRGYTIVVRHEPADTLLHVQVGPFATRPAANAMRQKLLADGYNAILK